MDFKKDGIIVPIAAAEQEDASLIAAFLEIQATAQERGLELPAFAGAVAIEANETANTTKEALLAHLPTAYKGYKQTLRSLGINDSEAASQADLEEDLEDRLTDDVIEYIDRAQEDNPELTFELVASPNVLVDAKSLIFAGLSDTKPPLKKQDIEDPFMEQYTAQQLCKTDPSNGRAVNFWLIPSHPSQDMIGTPEERLSQLFESRAQNPNVQLGVPSPLDALAYGETIMAAYYLEERFPGWEELELDVTPIIHFDLPVRNAGQNNFSVPESYSCADTDSFLTMFSYLDASVATHQPSRIGIML